MRNWWLNTVRFEFLSESQFRDGLPLTSFARHFGADVDGVAAYERPSFVPANVCSQRVGKDRKQALLGEKYVIHSDSRFVASLQNHKAVLQRRVDSRFIWSVHSLGFHGPLCSEENKRVTEG
jgi:hypothetical protein